MHLVTSQEVHQLVQDRNTFTFDLCCQDPSQPWGKEREDPGQLIPLISLWSQSECFKNGTEYVPTPLPNAVVGNKFDFSSMSVFPTLGTRLLHSAGSRGPGLIAAKLNQALPKRTTTKNTALEAKCHIKTFLHFLYHLCLFISKSWSKQILRMQD